MPFISNIQESLLLRHLAKTYKLDMDSSSFDIGEAFQHTPILERLFHDIFPFEYNIRTRPDCFEVRFQAGLFSPLRHYFAAYLPNYNEDRSLLNLFICRYPYLDIPDFSHRHMLSCELLFANGGPFSNIYINLYSTVASHILIGYNVKVYTLVDILCYLRALVDMLTTVSKIYSSCDTSDTSVISYLSINEVDQERVNIVNSIRINLDLLKQEFSSNILFNPYFAKVPYNLQPYFLSRVLVEKEKLERLLFIYTSPCSDYLLAPFLRHYTDTLPTISFDIDNLFLRYRFVPTIVGSPEEVLSSHKTIAQIYRDVMTDRFFILLKKKQGG